MFDKFLGKMGSIFGSNGVGDDPSIRYFINLIDLMNEDFRDYARNRSKDDGETAQILESGTIAFLSHEKVTQAMETYCENN